MAECNDSALPATHGAGRRGDPGSVSRRCEHTASARRARTIASGRAHVEGCRSRLDDSGFDQLWLIAVDGGDGLSPADARGINRFQRQGRGLLTARDHQDVGSSLCALERVGAAHQFHTRNPEPDPERRTRDDPETDSISWPNYHSGANGEYQWIEAGEPVHPLLLAPALPRGRVRRIPAHPHE